MKNKFIGTLLLCSLILLNSCTNNLKKSSANNIQKPNIIIIYTDDLGYGDIGANGSIDLKTPNIDKLAANGINFKNGFSTSATCTPSRYALLTGEYPWRQKSAKILPGTAPLIIDVDKTTLPKMLKENGYSTAIVGKWHLGLGSGNVDWNKKISPGPNDVGFDYSYIMAATQDRVPTVYIKNGKVEGLDPNDPIEVSYSSNFDNQPTGKDNPELLRMTWNHGHNNTIVNGIPRIGFMKGGEKAKWVDEEMADNFLAKAKNYVKSHKDSPFFLYYAMQQPHVPRTPSPRFQGKSGLGPRGDVILEADWCIGELIKTLKEEKLLDNTLIIFSSDNGPILNDGYNDFAVEKLGNHKPWGPFRGGKYSLFEAGTHVPFITYWKGKINPSTSNALVCQVDLLSSLAKLVGSDFRGKDSQDLLDVFLGKSTEGRNNLIVEATSRTAFKKGDWVMIPPYPGKAKLELENVELGNSPEYQLYNLKNDIGQKKNLAKTNPQKLQEMINEFVEVRGADYIEIEKIELK